MNFTKMENNYLDNEYETKSTTQKRIIEVSKKPTEETINEDGVELDTSKYTKTKAKKRVVAHVSLES